MNPANEPLREANRVYQLRRGRRWRRQRLVLVGALLFVEEWLTGGLLTEILVGLVLGIVVTGGSAYRSPRTRVSGVPGSREEHAMTEGTGV